MIEHPQLGILPILVPWFKRVADAKANRPAMRRVTKRYKTVEDKARSRH